MPESNLDVNRLVEINAKMMSKFVSSTSTVGVEILQGLCKVERFV